MNWRCRLGLHRWNCVVAWGDADQPHRGGEERCEREGCDKVRWFRYRLCRWEVYCVEWPVLRETRWSRRQALCVLYEKRASTYRAYERYGELPSFHWAMRMKDA